jgi:hypothetical protein
VSPSPSENVTEFVPLPAQEGSLQSKVPVVENVTISARAGIVTVSRASAALTKTPTVGRRTSASRRF